MKKRNKFLLLIMGLLLITLIVVFGICGDIYRGYRHRKGR